MTQKPNYIISLDLSITHCGIALLNTVTDEVVLDQIDTSSKDTFEKRIKDLRDGLQEVFEAYRYLTPYVVVELPRGSQSARAMKCSAAATAIFFCSPFADLPMTQYNPKTIKDFVGYKDVTGTARKRLTLNLMQELYPDAPWNLNGADQVMSKDEHRADALACAHINKIEWQQGLVEL